jgi:hypothetical protein
MEKCLRSWLVAISLVDDHAIPTFNPHMPRWLAVQHEIGIDWCAKRNARRLSRQVCTSDRGRVVASLHVRCVRCGRRTCEKTAGAHGFYDSSACDMSANYSQREKFFSSGCLYNDAGGNSLFVHGAQGKTASIDILTIKACSSIPFRR